MYLQIRNNTFSHELITLEKPKNDSESKTSIIKHSVSLIIEDIFGKISLFFLRYISFLSLRFKPWKISFPHYYENLHMTQSNVESFIVFQVQHYLHLQKKTTFSDEEITKVIRSELNSSKDSSAIEMINLIKKIQLKFNPSNYAILKELKAKKFKKSKFVKKSNCLKSLIEFFKNEDKKIGTTIFLKILNSGKVKISSNENKASMNITFIDNHTVLITKGKKEMSSLTNFALSSLNVSQEDLPLTLNRNTILDDLSERLQREQYHHYIHGVCPPEDRSDECRISLELQDGHIPLDMHKITLLDHHFIATSLNQCSYTDVFWRAVMETSPKTIVKLTQNSYFQPNYFPTKKKEVMEFEDITVTCRKVRKISNSIIKRKLEVEMDGKKLKVSHIDFSAWPDFSVPREEDFQQLIKVVEKEAPTSSETSPIMVHCGAGIGRTGTFIVGYSTKNLKKEEIQKDTIKNSILEIRKQRPAEMVETERQYLFLNKLLLQKLA